MIRVVSKKESLESQIENSESFICIDCTSRNPSKFFAEGLSPFYLGPIPCYDGLIANKMENAWQYSKVYKGMLDEKSNPNGIYFKFRDKGFQQEQAKRYPMGKDIKPIYSYWKIGENYYKLDYIQARKLIYIPLYAKAVVKTEAFAKLIEYRDKGYNIALSDFDGYNNFNYNLNYKQVVNNKNKKMGHAFVIAMLLEDLISVKNNEVVYSEELKNMIG